MRAAPGAQLATQEILGRDPFIAALWGILTEQSVRMEAERRIGKTCILQKMSASPPAGWHTIPLDLEKVHTAAEFAELVSKAVDDRLARWQRVGKRVRTFLGAIGGTQVGPIKFPEKKAQPEDYWKTLLQQSVEDLVEHQAAVGQRVVFFFDEMPWMLSAIASPDRDGAVAAMEILDVLRSLRQSRTLGSGFRMVLCGSIGLHHILKELRQKGYRNQPVNDLRTVEVPPLDSVNATMLATELLIGEELAIHPDGPGIIAQQTGGFPFYIHWVVARLRMDNQPVTSDTIERVVKYLLTDAHDPCHFRHFLDRLEDYYPQEEGKHVLALLDYTAASATPVAQQELINVAKYAGATDDDRVRELLRLLLVDHYLASDTDGCYTFRHALLRRWWVIARGLN
jgi:hypothetical protein